MRTRVNARITPVVLLVCEHDTRPEKHPQIRYRMTRKAGKVPEHSDASSDVRATREIKTSSCPVASKARLMICCNPSRCLSEYMCISVCVLVTYQVCFAQAASVHEQMRYSSHIDSIAAFDTCPTRKWHVSGKVGPQLGRCCKQGPAYRVEIVENNERNYAYLMYSYTTRGIALV